MYKQNPSWIFLTIQAGERKLLRDARENRVPRTLVYQSGGRFSRASPNNSRSLTCSFRSTVPERKERLLIV